MGLDASVRCNCYEKGLTAPPPFPDLISIDAEGHIALNLPHEDERWQVFEDWVEHGCAHRGMNYAAEIVSNWPGYRLFQQALQQVGWEHFPTLKAELPERNVGLTSSTAAARALQELSYFKDHAGLGTKVVLLNSETGEEIAAYIEGNRGIFQFTLHGLSRVDIGVDHKGFFIEKCFWILHREVFRSMRFEQRLLEPGPTWPHGTGKVEYLDVESGQRFVARTAVGDKAIPWPDGRMEDDEGRSRYEYPRRMHVERRGIAATDFAYILNPLTEVFQAAVATGNPVRWS